MKCDECKHDYPEEILAPLMSSEGGMNTICGICALKITNDIHGANRKKFQGEIAEYNRLEAVKYRKQEQR